MLKYLINFLLIILLFVVTTIVMTLSVMLREGFWEFPKGFANLLIFLMLFGITAFSLSKLKSRIHLLGVLVPIIIGVLLITLPKAYNSTPKFSLKVAPFYISILLGIISGYIYYKNDHQKFKIPLILCIFPLFMALGTYEMWVHKIEYGYWTGEIKNQEVASFELVNKQGDLINNQILIGKIVLFDFWFINCGPCWKKFPDLQRIYKQYETNPLVEIYAVNRPMRSDKPGALFSKIEEKGYTFPVLKGSQEIMDALGVYKYPTVMVINQNGEMVFMGELNEAEKKLESLLTVID